MGNNMEREAIGTTERRELAALVVEMRENKPAKRWRRREMYYIIFVIGHHFVYNIIFSSCWLEWFSLNGNFFYRLHMKVLLGHLVRSALCLWLLFRILRRIWLTPILHIIAQLQIQHLFIYLRCIIYIGLGLVSQPQFQTVSLMAWNQHVVHKQSMVFSSTHWKSQFFLSTNALRRLLIADNIMYSPFRRERERAHQKFKNIHTNYFMDISCSLRETAWVFVHLSAFFWGQSRRFLVASFTVWVNQVQVNRCTHAH